MHLSPEFGLTIDNIKKDGYKVTDKVEMLLSSDSSSAISKSIGLGLIGFSDKYELYKPDLVILLGDRFEILSAYFRTYCLYKLLIFMEESLTGSY